MITKKKGNLLTATGYIVHGCNAQGVMGSGVAKQIKYKWPRAYKAYVTSLLHVGKITHVTYGAKVTIINAITQEYYGREDKVYVDYEAVKGCFIKIRNLIEETDNLTGKLPVVNFPLIGCGLGGGDWERVSKIIDEAIPDDVAKKILWVR